MNNVNFFSENEQLKHGNAQWLNDIQVSVNRLLTTTVTVEITV